MNEAPETAELLTAVKAFLDDLRQTLSGHQAFHALVAGNVLEIVIRELRDGDAAQETALDGLRDLLGRDGDSESLTRLLCAAIRSGDLTVDDAELLDYLDRATLERLAIDQPGYSGARIAIEAGIHQRSGESQEDERRPAAP